MAEHGTRGGYNQHLLERTEPCGECRGANKEHSRQVRQRSRSRLAPATWRRIERRAEVDAISANELVLRALDRYDLI